MTLTQMRYYVVLAECLNYTTAAKKLFITQPSLSRQITLIENEIGTKLLFRSSKATSLTPAGRFVQEAFTRILEEYDQMRQSAQAIERQYSGSLRIAIVHLQVTHKGIIQIVQALKEEFPNLFIELTSRGYHEIMAGLTSGDIDLAITHDFELEGRPELLAVPISEMDNYLVVPRSHPNAELEQPSIRDFRDMDFITLVDEESPHLTQLCQESCRQAGFEPRIRLVRTYLDMCLAIEAEQGINGLNTENYLRNAPHLKFVKVPEIPNRMLMAVWNPENKNPAIQEFIHHASALSVQNLHCPLPEGECKRGRNTWYKNRPDGVLGHV